MAPRTRRREPPRPTRLQLELTEGRSTSRPTAIDAFKLARRRFHASQRIDMASLAEELGISRVTLYRWTGSREQLLVEVLWSRTKLTLDYVDERVDATGAERVIRIVVGFLELVIGDPGTRHYLATEAEAAMRLLTMADAGFQPRLVGAMEDLLHEEVDAGRLQLGEVDLHDVAYVLVRLIESYLYLDLICGEQPDAARAEPILRMLLR